jgi:hypothetical protein
MAYLVIIRKQTSFLVEAIPDRRSALGALAPDSAQHASDDPLATANDAFGLTLSPES